MMQSTISVINKKVICFNIFYSLLEYILHLLLQCTKRFIMIVTGRKPILFNPELPCAAPCPR